MKNNTTQLPPVSTEHFDWHPSKRTLVGQISDFGDEFNKEWIGRVFHGTNDTIQLLSHKTGNVVEFELVLEEFRRTGPRAWNLRAWFYRGTGELDGLRVTIYNS